MMRVPIAAPFIAPENRFMNQSQVLSTSKLVIILLQREKRKYYIIEKIDFEL